MDLAQHSLDFGLVASVHRHLCAVRDEQPAGGRPDLA